MNTLSELKTALAVLEPLLENGKEQLIQVMGRPDITPDEAYRSALQHQALNKLGTKLKADIVALEREIKNASQSNQK